MMWCFCRNEAKSLPDGRCDSSVRIEIHGKNNVPSRLKPAGPCLRRSCDGAAEKASRGVAQSPLVRHPRFALVHPPLARAADGLCDRGFRRQAGDRDRQHLERHQSLPRAFPHSRRGGQARRVAGRRLPAGNAGDRAGRTLPETLDHALPQHAGDGDRGAAARLPGGRRGADGRLRQDHPGAGDGGDLDGSAFHLCARRPDAARQLARRAAGFGQRFLEVLGGTARRHHHRE